MTADYRSTLQEAAGCLERGEEEAAVAMLRRCLESDPVEPEVCVLLARALLSKGEIEEIVEVVRPVLDRAGGEAQRVLEEALLREFAGWAYLDAAERHLNEGNPHAAAKSADRAMRIPSTGDKVARRHKKVKKNVSKTLKNG